MSHSIHRVRAFKIVGPYRLTVTFDDGTTQTIDFLPVLRGPLFGPLRDVALFEKVKIDPEVHTLVWPNGADFDPATLHNWDELAPRFEEMAREWEADSRPSRGSG